MDIGGGMHGQREGIDTITKNAAKVVAKKRWLCVGHVVVEDVLDGADVGEHDAIIRGGTESLVDSQILRLRI